MEKKNILVADKDELIRSLVQKVYAEESHNIHYAGCGEDAVQVVRIMDISYVILDLNISGLSGLETLKKIKKLDRSLPVVIVSDGKKNVPTSDAVQEALLNGAMTVFFKPFNIFDFIELIKEI